MSGQYDLTEEQERYILGILKDNCIDWKQNNVSIHISEFEDEVSGEAKLNIYIQVN